MFQQKKQYNKNWKPQNNYSNAGARPFSQFESYRNLTSAGVNQQNYDSLTKDFEMNKKDMEQIMSNVYMFMEGVAAKQIVPGAPEDVQTMAQAMLEKRRKDVYNNLFKHILKTYKEDYRRVNSVLKNDTRYLWCQEYGDKYKCRALLSIIDMALLENHINLGHQIMKQVFEKHATLKKAHSDMWLHKLSEADGAYNKTFHQIQLMYEHFEILHGNSTKREIPSAANNLQTGRYTDLEEFRRVIQSPMISQEDKQLGRLVKTLPKIQNIVDSLELGMTAESFMMTRNEDLSQQFKISKEQVSDIKTDLKAGLRSCRELKNSIAPMGKVMDVITCIEDVADKLHSYTEENITEILKKFNNPQSIRINDVSAQFYRSILAAATVEFYMHGIEGKEITDYTPWNPDEVTRPNFTNFVASLAGQLAIYSLHNQTPKYVYGSHEEDKKKKEERVEYLKRSFYGSKFPWNNVYNMGLHVKRLSYTYNLYERNMSQAQIAFGLAGYMDTNKATIETMNSVGEKVGHEADMNKRLKPLFSSWFDMNDIQQMIQTLHQEAHIGYASLVVNDLQKDLTDFEATNIFAAKIAEDLGKRICKLQ